MKTNRDKDKSTESANDLSSQTLYHGTKTNFKSVDMIEPGFNLCGVRCSFHLTPSKGK